MNEKVRVSIYEVAKRAGVSIATVSRAINRSGGVSPEIAKRISLAVDELGYLPTRAAQDLSRRSSRLLAAVIPSLDYAIFARKVEAFKSQAARKGYGVLLATSSWDQESEYAQCMDLVRSGVKGIMLEGGTHLPKLYEQLNRHKVAYVNTSVYAPEGEHPSIGFKNAEIGARAVGHLLDLGHKRFAVIAGMMKDSDRALERIKGIRAKLASYGIDLPASHVVQCQFRVGDARQALRFTMKLDPPPTAIICTNDVLALGAILECQHAGIDIPGELSIIGFDDLDWAAHLSPPLTTFYVPTSEIGTQSAEYLIARLESVAVADHVEMEVPFLLRGSTGSAPTLASEPQ